MSSRMDRYHESNEVIGSRTKRNEQLYQEIINSDLDEVNLSSNAHVIGDNDNNIDINKIKELLEKKYREEPKKVKTFEITEEIDEEIVDEEITKEYDINAIIEKAKLDKNVDYERERLKKIHDTQYNILKSLELEKEKELSKVTSNKEDLLQLIHTITEKESEREVDPLDILTDLKGSENTVILEGISKEAQKQEIKETVKEEIKKEMDTFYTNSLSFTQSDFDDFNDLKEDVESNKIIVRTLLVIVVLASIIGIIFLVNSVFQLNWF